MSGFERWVGKVAIVTGASSGIGAAIAERLVKEGLTVVGLARRSEILQKAADKLAGEKGKLYAVKCDVSKEEDIVKSFTWISENLGPIHILVNNAGIGPETGLTDGDRNIWRKTIDVNILGLLTCTREAVKIMKDGNINGHIIHINSIAGHYPFYLTGINVYSATKHAVTDLTEVLRRELIEKKLKIKVTSVSPGLVDTEILKVDGKIRDCFQNLPLLNSEDVADAVYYALSTKPHVQIQELIVRPLGELI